MQHKLDQVEKLANSYFVERADEIHGFVIALLSDNNQLLLGPPGTAKTKMIQFLCECIIEPEQFYHYLINKYTNPEEILGPPSLVGLENDRYYRITQGRLPECTVAFLDEIFKGNSALLNVLLPLANERVYFNEGRKETKIAVIVGASNEIPEDSDNLEALFDRFILKYNVKPIREEGNFKRMISLNEIESQRITSIEDVLKYREEVNKIEFVPDNIDLLFEIRSKLIANGFIITDRTYRNVIRIVKAEAFYNKRKKIEPVDFEILQHALWTEPETKKKIASLILDLINPQKNKINELVEDAEALYNEVVNRPTKEIKDKAEQLKVSIEKIAKLKKIQEGLADMYKESSTLGKNTVFIETAQKSVDNYLQKIYSVIGPTMSKK